MISRQRCILCGGYIPAGETTCKNIKCEGSNWARVKKGAWQLLSKTV